MLIKARRGGPNARLCHIGELRHLLQLLRSSQQIYAEVVPVAYGAVTFNIYASGGVIRWLRTLGSMKQHIRHVRIESFIKTHMRSIFHQLKLAGFIQTITLSAHILGPTVSEITEALKPFIKSLKDARDRVKTEDDVLEVIRVVPVAYIFAEESSRPNEWLLEVELQKAEEHSAVIRAALKNLLA